MKSYMSLICVSTLLFFCACKKDFIEPLSSVAETPIAPTTTTPSILPTVPRSSTLQTSANSTILTTESSVPVATITDMGIRGVSVGEPIKKMIDIYGTALNNYSVKNGEYQHSLWYFNKGIITSSETNKSTTLDVNSKIICIELFEPFDGKTIKNIGIGSSKASVIAAYGQPTSSNVVEGDKYENMYIKYNSATAAVESITIKN